MKKALSVLSDLQTFCALALYICPILLPLPIFPLRSWVQPTSQWLLLIPSPLAMAALLFLFLFFPSPPDPAVASSHHSSLIHFDAEHSQIFADDQRQKFSGHVFALSSDILITADTIYRTPELLHAQGHVIMIYDHKLFEAQSIKYLFASQSIVSTNALVISDHSRVIAQNITRILGYSAQEKEFERQRHDRLHELSLQEQSLLHSLSLSTSRSRTPSKDHSTITQQLAEILEQKHTVIHQKNPYFHSLPPRQRQRYQQRRRIYRSFENFPAILPESLPHHQYQDDNTEEGSTQNPFMIAAKKLIFQHQNTAIEAQEVRVTPCLCEDFDDAPWSLSARTWHSQHENYIHLDDVRFHLRGLPIAYLPKLILPNRTIEQSGLLPPLLRWDSIKGLTFSQPLFLKLSPHWDLTLTGDITQKNGLRMHGEHRYHGQDLDALSLKWAVIDDPLWHQYISENSTPAPSPDPLRGHVTWQARSDLSSRLALFSEGTWLSDQRYFEHWPLSTAITDPRSQHDQPTMTFTRRQLQGSLYHPLGHLDISSHFTDHLLVHPTLQEWHKPLAIESHSSTFTLFHHPRFTLYGQGQIRHHQLQLTSAPFFSSSSQDTHMPWTQGTIEFIAPWRLHPKWHTFSFLTTQVESIRPPQGDPIGITSTRAGLRIHWKVQGNTPLGTLPLLWYHNPYYHRSTLQHLFYIGAQLSTRPYVHSSPSTASSSLSSPLSPQTSSSPPSYQHPSQDLFVTSSSSSQHTITFFTQHFFALHNTRRPFSSPSSSSSHFLQAAQTSIQHAITPPAATTAPPPLLFPLSTQLALSYNILASPTPASITPSPSTSPIFPPASTRISPGSPPALPSSPSSPSQPFSPLAWSWTFHHSFLTSRLTLLYDLYQHQLHTSHIRTQLSNILHSSIAWEYRHEHQTIPTNHAFFASHLVKTHSLIFTTHIIPRFKLSLRYDHKQPEHLPQTFSSQSFGIHYLPDSRCWGLSFQHHKDFADGTTAGQPLELYQLQLHIVLGPTTLSSPNILGNNPNPSALF